MNAAGYEGEKGYHGTPSGIDNTAATFGGVLRFQRTESAPIFIKKKIKSPVRIVYASTGITASTSKVVGDVRAKKEADPAWFDALLTKCATREPSRTDWRTELHPYHPVAHACCCGRYVALQARGEAALDRRCDGFRGRAAQADQAQRRPHDLRGVVVRSEKVVTNELGENLA